MAIGQIFGPKLYAVMSNSGMLLFIIALLAVMAEVDKDIVATRNFSGFLMQVAKIGDEISVTPHPRAVQSVSQAYNMERSRSIRGFRPFKKTSSSANKSSHSASTAITEPTSNVTTAAGVAKERQPSIILESPHKSPLFDEKIQHTEMRGEEADYLNSNEGEIDPCSTEQNIEIASHVDVAINLNNSESQPNKQVHDNESETATETGIANESQSSEISDSVHSSPLFVDEVQHIDTRNEEANVYLNLNEDEIDSCSIEQNIEMASHVRVDINLNNSESQSNTQVDVIEVEDGNKSETTKDSELPETSGIITTKLINDEANDRRSEPTPRQNQEGILENEHKSMVQQQKSEFHDEKSDVIPQPFVETVIDDVNSSTTVQPKGCDIGDSSETTPVAAKAIMKSLMDDVDVFIDEEIGDVANLNEASSY